MKPNIFIDGEAGTTGLRLKSLLAGRDKFDLVSIDAARRKLTHIRREYLNAADIVILCLPDTAAREAVTLIDNPNVRIIDASSAHRTDADWTYGFPEMSKGQGKVIRQSRRVTNPGCYPTGFIALMRPLIEAGLVPQEWPVSVHAVSGYSGGGKALIHLYESGKGEAYRAYALKGAHKHLTEMRRYTGLNHAPHFSPSVAAYAQGMLVEIPLPLWALPKTVSRSDIHAVLSAAYSEAHFVTVHSLDLADHLDILEPEARNGTNFMDLYVCGTDDALRLMARFDNLGKGAAGAAVQNLNLMLGLAEDTGL